MTNIKIAICYFFEIHLCINLIMTSASLVKYPRKLFSCNAQKNKSKLDILGMYMIKIDIDIEIIKLRCILGLSMQIIFVSVLCFN